MSYLFLETKNIPMIILLIALVILSLWLINESEFFND